MIDGDEEEIRTFEFCFWDYTEEDVSERVLKSYALFQGDTVDDFKVIAAVKTAIMITNHDEPHEVEALLDAWIEYHQETSLSYSAYLEPSGPEDGLNAIMQEGQDALRKLP